MKKAFDQTVRDLKRGVNKKVLKVPSIEQKVLDATSNEPWGPHGSLLADIAQATRNYHEYQMIMSVLWKRINDTGKNWRHVYKALTILEYLVAHGSERVVDDIREHAYQISTLSDFQYIDSSGKDQGNNVRKKSQSLVVLVNDKERIQEARQKAASNREKYRNTPMGGMYRPGSGGYGDRYDDDRSEGRHGYGNRDDDRNGYAGEREWGSRDDDRYGRHGESYGREGDKYGRDNEDRYGRDGYRDDDYRGRGQNDDYNYGSRSRSADRERNSGTDDDGQYSSRESGAKADDQSQDGSTVEKRFDSRYSEQSVGAPPSYEDAVDTTRSPPYSERDGESSLPYAPKASSPTRASPSHTTTAAQPPASASPPATASPPVSFQPSVQHSNNEGDGFDEFDPRGSFSAAPATSNGTAPASAVEMDFLGSLSESFSSNSLALVSARQADMGSEANTSANFNSGPTTVDASTSSMNNNQPFDDPFGDGPFKAVPTTDNVPVEQQISASTNSFTTNSSQSLNVPQPVPQKAATEFGGNYHDPAYMPSGPSSGQPPTNAQFPQPEFSTTNQDIDILADILPPSAPSCFANTQAGYPGTPSPSVSHGGFPPQTNQHEIQAQPGQPSGFPTQHGQPSGFPTQHGQPSGFPAQHSQPSGFPAQHSQPSGFPTQHGQPSGFPTQQGQPSGFPTQQGQPSGFPTQQGQPSGFPTQQGQPPLQASYPLQSVGSVSQTGGFPNQIMGSTFPVQGGPASQMGYHPQIGSAQPNPSYPNFYGTYQPQPASAAPPAAYTAPPSSAGPTMQHNYVSNSGSGVPVASHMGPQAPQVQSSSLMVPVPTTHASSAIVPKSSTDKFETKSTVWADTLSRGLVNLNISGSKTNPLADIGVDFDAINRKEKRMEKPTTTQATSTITMGKAMGSGSGIGRAGATALRPAPNPMMGAGMNYGMAGGPSGGMGMGMGMGGYGANQPAGRGMGMGMNMPGNMGMGMNMGMGQAMNMQQPMGPPGSTMPGGYNPMMGPGNYNQQPYGGGYR